MIKIELTDEQKQQLKPLFEQIKGHQRSVIAAQVWPDGFVAIVKQDEAAVVLCQALGGDGVARRGSAAEAIEYN